ncbi:iclR helix-turn-helix domain protein [Delftia acidovorans]|nr:MULTISPECIES: FadR/GntR family transcriptional regulator [Delftia]MCP4017275.1 FadR family transcriptional regulator [Delftia sp.]OLE95772.1 MAG: GntR family transcriptional regulator [Delftia sp. 13_1_40CM_3_66_6]APE50552.1 GntR family transcriptional regulator [Delftia sp. HK171]KFJ12130.1 iclR helix-turn-helix domain protein [Delftia acidovorans]MBO0986237.1 FadR family transcriptional regulator [Delftia sp. SD083]
MEPSTASSPSASTAVAGNAARVIREWIEGGVYPVGALLPSQRDLSEQLGISRTSLREALSTLQGLGLVVARPGKGMYVTEATDAPASGAEAWRFADSHALTDVYQLRYALEGFVARLAALVVQPEDVAALQANLQAMQQSIELADFVQATRLDFEFHLQIATISGNHAIADVLRGSGEVMQESQRLPYYKRGARHATAEEHAAIIEALSQGRPELAQQAMATHIVQAAQRAGVHFPTGL